MIIRRNLCKAFDELSCIEQATKSLALLSLSSRFNSTRLFICIMLKELRGKTDEPSILWTREISPIIHSAGHAVLY